MLNHISVGLCRFGPGPRKEGNHMFYGFDIYYFIFIVPAMLVALWAQYKVNSTYSKYSKVGSVRRLTGAQAARAILDMNGLQHVAIERISGSLTDHFDPKTNVVRLSDSVYNNYSIAAVGVAAHECGHAVQYAQGYSPMKLRSAIIPLTNFGSTISIPLILVGFLLTWDSLVVIGILLFSTVTVFQLVTLPVEFNASSRAIQVLDSQGMLTPDELKGTKKVLSADAMTYVAALITSLAQLLRLVMVFGNRRRD